MSIHPDLLALAGRWKGSSRLWLTPDEPVRISETEAAVSTAGRDRFLVVSYAWREGERQEGMIVLGQQGEEAQVFWIDSWHNGDRIMPCAGKVDAQGRVNVLGSYPAPPGPDWGWRIVIEPGQPCKLSMFNITPDGQEVLAVEAVYTRE